MAMAGFDFARFGRGANRVCTAVALGALGLLAGCASMPTGAGAGASEAQHSTAVQTRTPDEIRALAAEARRKGDAEAALRLYVEAADADPANADSFYQIGVIYEERHDAERAARAYMRAVQLDSTHAAASAALGLLYFGNRQLAEAAPLLERAVAVEPGNWRPHNALGLIADANGQHEVAAGHYAAALAASPGNATILNNRGYSSYLAGNLADAERDFQSAIAADGRYEKAWQNLGLLYARRGDYEQALVTLQRVMSPYVAANDVGYIAMLAGDYDRAQTLFDDAIRLSPRYYATANENMGELRRRRSEQTQAAVQR